MYVTLRVSFGFGNRFERSTGNTRTLIAITHFIHWERTHGNMTDLKIKKSKKYITKITSRLNLG